MICSICTGQIKAGDETHDHHTVYKSRGGVETEKVHKCCHIALHSSRNDFAIWGAMGGKKAALSGAWSVTLKHVKTHDRYEPTRRAYRQAKGV